ncbi:MAG: aldehyde dehydrogenase [Bdellovibrionaceae bacterium]|nr:aldehyde dehydrogenase [Pseudobdellovibrionaceae bacterium]
MEKILNYINGEWLSPKNGKFQPNKNPATGLSYSEVPDSDADDAELAISAATAAFPSWSKTSVRERSELMRKLAELIKENADSLSRDESTDNGKPHKLASEVDIPRSELNFRFFADLAVSLHGEAYRSDANTMSFTEHAPLGPVVCISPWNLPLYLLTWKIAPALAAGCTVVAKPSEITPMTAYRLSQLAAQAGFPKGVLNFVHGRGSLLGEKLSTDPRIKAISFTGSTQTGRTIATLAAPLFKKLALEMGGKNPVVIFKDAEYDKMLSTVVRSSFSNQGQICLCGSRIFVERPLYEKFKKDFIARVGALNVGDPFNMQSDLGAVVSEDHMGKILSYIKKARDEGGVILTGGEQLKVGGGYFVQPTVIENLDYNSCVNQDEIFGPVVTITPFDSEEQVTAMANSTRYGLAASVWTTNLNRAQRIARQIDSGIVWVNTWMNRDLRTPFGGVKESGYGREGGIEALKFFSEVKTICIETSPEQDKL